MNHERTRIYTKSIELNEACAKVVARMPQGFSYLADQIRRAASSVTLTYAEGARRSSLKDRRHFFTIASGSASEVSAAIDIAVAYGVAKDADRVVIKDLCDHISAMLRNFR